MARYDIKSECFYQVETIPPFLPAFPGQVPTTDPSEARRKLSASNLLSPPLHGCVALERDNIRTEVVGEAISDLRSSRMDVLDLEISIVLFPKKLLDLLHSISRKPLKELSLRLHDSLGFEGSHDVRILQPELLDSAVPK